MTKTAANGNGAATERYQISKDVPIPPIKTKRSSYPLAKMEVGDSFAVQEGELGNVRSAVSYYGIRHAGLKFSIRVSDPITKAHRCWRIA